LNITFNHLSDKDKFEEITAGN